DENHRLVRRGARQQSLVAVDTVVGPDNRSSPHDTDYGREQSDGQPANAAQNNDAPAVQPAQRHGSALELPLFSDELLPDVSLELAEVVVAASDLGRPEVLKGRVVLPRHLAEILHGGLVGPREPRLAFRKARSRSDEVGIESEALFEIGRRRRDADS